MSVVIPDKTYFKIGEVAKLIGVKAYILRYWESEFRVLRPHKTRSQHRLYRRRDVEILCQIRHLLYEEKYTIAGAKQRIHELIKEGRFVPGKSGLVITTSEIERLVDETGSSDPGLAPGDEIDVVQLTGESTELVAEPGGAEGAPAAADEVAEVEALRRELAQVRASASDQQRELERQLSCLRLELEEARCPAADDTVVASGEGDEGLAAELESAAAELQLAREALDAQRSAHAALSGERDGLLATRERLREKLRERGEALKGLDLALEEARAELAGLADDRAALARELEHERVRVADTAAALDAAAERHAQAVAAERSAHQRALDEVEAVRASEVGRLTQALAAARAEVERVGQRASERLEREHAEALAVREKVLRDEFAAALERQRDEVERVRREHVAVQARLRGENERLNTQLAELQVVRSSHEELATDHEALRRELGELRSRHAALSSEYDGLQSSVQELAARLERERTERDETVRRLESELVASRKRLSESEARLQSLRDAAGERDMLRGEIEALRGEKESIEGALRRHATRRRALSRDLRLQLLELNQVVQRVTP